MMTDHKFDGSQSDTPVWDSLKKPDALTLTDAEYAQAWRDVTPVKVTPKPRQPRTGKRPSITPTKEP